MTRGRRLLVYLLVVLISMAFWSADPINPENIAQIQNGMKVKQVAALFGESALFGTEPSLIFDENGNVIGEQREEYYRLWYSTSQRVRVDCLGIFVTDVRVRDLSFFESIGHFFFRKLRRLVTPQPAAVTFLSLALVLTADFGWRLLKRSKKRSWFRKVKSFLPDDAGTSFFHRQILEKKTKDTAIAEHNTKYSAAEDPGAKRPPGR
jgi:hypothetical protein